MSDIDLVIVVVMFLAGYWIVSYFWPGSKRGVRGEGDEDPPAPGDSDAAGDGEKRPRQ